MGNNKKQSNPFHCLKATNKCVVTLIISCERYLQIFEYAILDTISEEISLYLLPLFTFREQNNENKETLFCLAY